MRHLRRALGRCVWRHAEAKQARPCDIKAAAAVRRKAARSVELADLYRLRVTSFEAINAGQLTVKRG